LINFVDAPVKVFPSVGGRETETSTAEQKRGGRIGYRNDCNISLQAFSREASHFSKVVNHHGNNGRVFVTEHLETSFSK